MSTSTTIPTTRLLYQAKLPALEMRWLARHDKQMPTPTVIYVEGLVGAMGYYCPPWPWTQTVSGIEVPPSCGTILVDVRAGDEQAAATLAHEFRHHWQQWNGWRYDGVPWTPVASLPAWIAATQAFYRGSRCELDALRFQARHVGDELSRWTLALCTSAAGTPF